MYVGGSSSRWFLKKVVLLLREHTDRCSTREGGEYWSVRLSSVQRGADIYTIV
jgi:hypothetical protein